MNKPDDSAIKPENMTPSELEGFIQDRADAHNRDKRTAYWTIYVPLARAWKIHFLLVQKNGVLDQYDGVKDYCKIKFNNSHELFRLSVNAEQYADVMPSAWVWLDAGCHDFDTDPSWHGWQPKETYTPKWAKEVAEAYLNRMSPMPVKKPKAEKDAEAESDEGEDAGDKLSEPLTVDQATDLLWEGENLKKELRDRLAEIISLDQQLTDAKARVTQLETILIEHQIAIPEVELSNELKDWIEGQVEEVADDDHGGDRYEAVVDDNAAEWFRTWLLADQAQTKQEEVNAEASKSKRGGARPGAGRKKKIEPMNSDPITDAP